MDELKILLDTQILDFTWAKAGVTVESVPRNTCIAHGCGTLQAGPNSYPIRIRWPTFPHLPFRIYSQVVDQRWMMLFPDYALLNGINVARTLYLVEALVASAGLTLNTNESD
jgi:hypothetical protein